MTTDFGGLAISCAFSAALCREELACSRTCFISLVASPTAFCACAITSPVLVRRSLVTVSTRVFIALTVSMSPCTWQLMPADATAPRQLQKSSQHPARATSATARDETRARAEIVILRIRLLRRGGPKRRTAVRVERGTCVREQE